MKIPQLGTELIYTGGQTDTTKLIVILPNFRNRLKKVMKAKIPRK